MKRAVFFDRDGTLIYDKEYMYKTEDLEIINGVAETLATLKKRGYALFILSNQSGVPRGYFTLEQAEQFNEHFIELLGLGKDIFDGVCLAIEPPDSTNGYRKPSPKYIVEQSKKYGFDEKNVWVVGDRRSDWQTAVNAGCNAIAVKTGKPIEHKDIEFIAEHNIRLVDKIHDALKILP